MENCLNQNLSIDFVREPLILMNSLVLTAFFDIVHCSKKSLNKIYSGVFLGYFSSLL